MHKISLVFFFLYYYYLDCGKRYIDIRAISSHNQLESAIECVRVCCDTLDVNVENEIKSGSDDQTDKTLHRSQGTPSNSTLID